MSIGIQDSLDQLMEKIDEGAAPPAISASRSRSSPGWDIDAVERVRAKFGDIPLMVDANAAYTLDDARACWRGSIRST